MSKCRSFKTKDTDAKNDKKNNRRFFPFPISLKTHTSQVLNPVFFRLLLTTRHRYLPEFRRCMSALKNISLNKQFILLVNPLTTEIST